MIGSVVLAGCAPSGSGGSELGGGSKMFIEERPPQDSPNSEPALGPVPTITDPSQITRPIDRYLVTVEQGTTLSMVAARQLNDCIRSHGSDGSHSWVAPNAAGAPTGAAAFRLRWAFALTDASTRLSLWGFFLVRSAATDGFTPPNQWESTVNEQSTPAPDSVELACVPSRRLNGLEPERYGNPFYLPEGGPVMPMTDSRWVVAVKEWRACMAGRGYPDATLMSGDMSDTAGARRGESDTEHEQRGESKAAEIARAVADVQCKISTNLVGKGVAIQSAYDSYYIGRHQSELNAFIADRDKFLR